CRLFSSKAFSACLCSGPSSSNCSIHHCAWSFSATNFFTNFSVLAASATAGAFFLGIIHSFYTANIWNKNLMVQKAVVSKALYCCFYPIKKFFHRRPGCQQT